MFKYKKITKALFKGKKIQNVSCSSGELLFQFDNNSAVQIVIAPNSWGKPEFYIKDID